MVIQSISAARHIQVEEVPEVPLAASHSNRYLCTLSPWSGECADEPASTGRGTQGLALPAQIENQVS